MKSIALLYDTRHILVSDFLDLVISLSGLPIFDLTASRADKKNNVRIDRCHVFQKDM